MLNPRQLLSAALVSGLLLTPGAAEARFGKRSSPKQEEKKEKKEKKKRGDKQVHDADPVGSPRSDSGGDRPRPRPRPSYRGPRGSTVIAVVPAPPPTTHYRPRRELEPEPEQRRSQVMVRMGMDGYALRDGGAALGLNLGFEGHRWGVNGALTSLLLPTDDGTAGSDQIQLLSGHVTYALATSDRGRWRLEAGVASAHAPDITFIGPSIATSFERCLFWGLDVEGRAQLVPVPHLQLDAQAGLALHMGILTLRGGWRWLLLDDRGHVDGVVHRDRFVGPYLGLGLNF